MLVVNQNIRYYYVRGFYLDAFNLNIDEVRALRLLMSGHLFRCWVSLSCILYYAMLKIICPPAVVLLIRINA